MERTINKVPLQQEKGGIPISYIKNSKETAATRFKATSSDLPNGTFAVYLHSRIAKEGKHSTICISYIIDLKGKMEDEILKLIEMEIFGLLHISNHEIQSLSLTPNMIKYLHEFDVKEIFLKIGTRTKRIDRHIKVVPTESPVQYEQLCSSIIQSLKKSQIL